jgi:hypothetical protein
VSFDVKNISSFHGESQLGFILTFIIVGGVEPINGVFGKTLLAKDNIGFNSGLLQVMDRNQDIYKIKLKTKIK